MSGIRQDFRYGFRMLVKSPGFTAVAILTLALGIGASTAIFSVVYAALLRPLPYARPSRLITLGEVRSASELNWNASYPDYLDWKRQSRAFQSLAGFSRDGFIFRGGGEPQLLVGAQVTPNFFATLGVKPFLGRDFAAGEDVASGPKVAILGYGFWRTRFGGDPRVVGRTIQLDANSVTVVGVLPRSFEFAPEGGAGVWVPLHLGKDLAGRRNLRWMSVLGRLAPGLTPAQARAEMTTINTRLAAAYPQANGSTRVLMIPLRDRIVGRIQPLLMILFGAVGFVLLIACANVANLLMARAAGRRREFAVRAALGAGRRRLAAQMLTESLMLSLAGGGLGFGVALWGTPALVAAIPAPLLASMPYLRDTRPNAAILAFLAGVAVLTGILFGLAPAWQASQERIGDALKEETRASAGGVRTRLRDALVIAEIAFSLLLLVSAGLMVQSLGALLHRNPGFDTRNLLAFSVILPQASYPQDADAVRFDHVFRRRLQAAPGIAGAASTSIVPLTGGGNSIRFLIEGQPVATGHEDESAIRDVSADYFAVMRIPLVAGRFFNEAADGAGGPRHVIVNQAWVERYLHGENAIGKRIKFTYSPTQPYREIVGVVGNYADAGLDSPDAPALFCPFDQDADSYINYVVRAASPAVALGAVRETLRHGDPRLFPVQPLTMDQIIDQSPSVFLRRYPSYLIGGFAVLALLLAVVGLYGLISYSVSQRTRELGIRIALGARQRDVARMIVGHGARLALIGVGAGVAASVALTRLLRSLLFGVSAVDLPTFAAVAVLLLLVAIAACYLPARRAMRTDPIAALRYE